MQVSALFITAFMVGLSGAMMPGPLLTATIAQSSQRGFSAGPLIVLGHAILELFLVVAILSGLSTFLTREAVTNIIAILGGIVLLYFGFTMTRDALGGRIATIQTDQSYQPKRLMHPALTGIVISLSNPYWSVWWATIGLSYLTMALKSNGGVAAFYSGHIMADLVWYSLIAAIVTGGRRFISPGVFTFILVLCGIFMFGLGGYFIYTGFAG